MRCSMLTADGLTNAQGVRRRNRSARCRKRFESWRSRVWANGMLRVSFAGVQGRSYSLQASLALDQEWQPLTTFLSEKLVGRYHARSLRVLVLSRFFKLVTPANP